MRRFSTVARPLGTHTRILSNCTELRTHKVYTKPKNISKTQLRETIRHERDQERRDDDAKVIITAYGLFAAYFMLLK